MPRSRVNGSVHKGRSSKVASLNHPGISMKLDAERLLLSILLKISAKLFVLIKRYSGNISPPTKLICMTIERAKKRRSLTGNEVTTFLRYDIIVMTNNYRKYIDSIRYRMTTRHFDRYDRQITCHVLRCHRRRLIFFEEKESGEGSSRRRSVDRREF